MKSLKSLRTRTFRLGLQQAGLGLAALVLVSANVVFITNGRATATTRDGLWWSGIYSCSDGSNGYQDVQVRYNNMTVGKDRYTNVVAVNFLSGNFGRITRFTVDEYATGGAKSPQYDTYVDATEDNSYDDSGSYWVDGADRTVNGTVYNMTPTVNLKGFKNTNGKGHAMVWLENEKFQGCAVDINIGN